jgi:hypothetical protein
LALEEEEEFYVGEGKEFFKAWFFYLGGIFFIFGPKIERTYEKTI